MDFSHDFKATDDGTLIRRLYIWRRTATYERYDPELDRWIVGRSQPMNSKSARPVSSTEISREEVEGRIGAGRADEPGEATAMFSIEPLPATMERAKHLVEMIERTQGHAKFMIEIYVEDNAMGGMGDGVDYGIDRGFEGDAAYRTLAALWEELRLMQWFHKRAIDEGKV